MQRGAGGVAKDGFETIPGLAANPASLAERTSATTVAISPGASARSASCCCGLRNGRGSRRADPRRVQSLGLEHRARPGPTPLMNLTGWQGPWTTPSSNIRYNAGSETLAIFLLTSLLAAERISGWASSELILRMSLRSPGSSTTPPCRHVDGARVMAAFKGGSKDVKEAQRAWTSSPKS